MSGWQLIDTAPRDGTIIDGWMVLSVHDCPKCGGGYSVGNRIPEIYWTLDAWYKNGAKVGNTVTHWMPRPEPPEGVSESNGF